MYGANHAVLGAAGGFLAGTYLEAPFTTRILMGAVGAFGGLISDADTKSSILGRYLPDFWHKLTPGHRRFTHSLFYCGLVFGIAVGVQMALQAAEVIDATAYYYPIALTVGVLTHLFADSLTVQGVPLFHPLIKRRFRLLGPFSFKTGSGVEPAVVTLLLSLAAAYVLLPLTEGITTTIATPEVFGLPTEKLVVFVATVAICGLALTLYRLRKKGKSSSRKRKSSRR